MNEFMIFCIRESFGGEKIGLFAGISGKLVKMCKKKSNNDVREVIMMLEQFNRQISREHQVWKIIEDENRQKTKERWTNERLSASPKHSTWKI